MGIDYLAQWTGSNRQFSRVGLSTYPSLTEKVGAVDG